VKTVHVLQTGHRLFKLTITELPDRIKVEHWVSRLGAGPDIGQIEKFFVSKLAKYDSDPRPTEVVHPVTGDRAVTYGDATNSITIIIPSNNHAN